MWFGYRYRKPVQHPRIDSEDLAVIEAQLRLPDRPRPTVQLGQDGFARRVQRYIYRDGRVREIDGNQICSQVCGSALFELLEPIWMSVDAVKAEVRGIVGC